jgi:hypothetical protein
LLTVEVTDASGGLSRGRPADQPGFTVICRANAKPPSHHSCFGSTSRHQEAKGESIWTSTTAARLDSLSFALPCRLCSGRWPCLRLRPAPRRERRNSGPRARMRHGGCAAITFRTRIKSPPAWCEISTPSVPVVGPCSAAPPSDERGVSDASPDCRDAEMP